MKITKKFFLILMALAALSFCFAACGDDEDEGGSSFDNAASCQNWLDSISCGDFDPSTAGIDCSAYDGLACDVSDYFDCLTDNFKCDDSTGTSLPDVSGWANCTDKAQCN